MSFVCLATCLIATAADNPPTGGKIVAASLFKNGYAVVVREADLGANGEVNLVPPTNAVIGTLWISSGQGVNLAKVKVSFFKSESLRNVDSFDELLSANLNKTVTVETTPTYSGQNLTLKGKLLSASGTVVVIDMAKERMVIQKSAVVRVTGENNALVYQLPVRTSQRTLQVMGAGKGKVYMVSLQKGMMWAPSYQLDVSDPKSAALTAKAVILNDLGELENVSVNLVTGFPNMKFLGIPDPLSSGASVDQFIQSLAYAATDNDYKKDLMFQNMTTPSGGIARGEEGVPVTGEGQMVEDLFFYKQPSVSLEVGERGYFNILKSQSDYKQVYVVELGDLDWGRPESLSTPPPPVDVWHTIKFLNKSGQPFTTAPVTTIKDGLVLGQDQLNYTSAGSEATVRVTKALDIHVDAVMEELSRDRGALKLANSVVYDKVTVKGTIEVSNSRAVSADVNIAKTTTGEVVDPGGAKVRKTPAGLRQVNPVSNLAWKVTVGTGETKRIEYRVSLFVPSTGY